MVFKHLDNELTEKKSWFKELKQERKLIAGKGYDLQERLIGKLISSIAQEIHALEAILRNEDRIIAEEQAIAHKKTFEENMERAASQVFQKKEKKK